MLGDAFLASFIEEEPFVQVPGVFRLDDCDLDKLLTVTLWDIRNKIESIIEKLEDIPDAWFVFPHQVGWWNRRYGSFISIT